MRTTRWRRRIAQVIGAIVGLGATFGFGIAVLLHLCVIHITP
ncbi:MULTISPECIES: hypothetical protein [unclassified Amycolatopsis]|nr:MULTISPECIES: hypothetical protein [unclassified Amycolatopsis]